MPIVETSIPDLIEFHPRVFEDERGYFYESYNEQLFNDAGVSAKFVQDNQSKSKRGVLRGLHYQLGPYAQAKLVRVISGSVIDVAVDIRKGSPTYGQHHIVELTAENKKQLYVPRGFAHGFLVTSEEAEFFYKCDNFYSKEHEGGIIYNDETLNINWDFDENELIISEKDQVLPKLEDALNNFNY